MSMLDGVSQCWWLSKSCAVDWNAWSAIATGSGVLLALAMPAIRWLWTRKRANALFALAFDRDLRWARARLMSIAQDYPVGRETTEAWVAEAELMTDADQRNRFGAAGAPLVTFAEREVDLSRWPNSVSLSLASTIALAQSSCHAVADALKAGANGPDGGDGWKSFWPRFVYDLDAALTHCGAAIAAVDLATSRAGFFAR